MRATAVLALSWACAVLLAASAEAAPAGRRGILEVEFERCQAEYRAPYAAHYALDPDAWAGSCKARLEAPDILALAQHSCRARYDEPSMFPLGLSRERWDAFCGDAAATLSPEQFLADALKAHIAVPPSVTAGALALRRRRELERIASLDPKDAPAALARFFDGARVPGEEPLAVDAGGASAPRRRGKLAPAAPARDKEQAAVLEKIAGLEALRKEDGTPRHDPRTIAALRSIVAPVSGRGRPQTPGLTACADASRVVEALERGVRVEWTTDGARDENYIHEPLRKAFINVRGSDGRALSPEQLAGLLLHGVGGHADALSRGGGTNMLVNELDAWYLQYRYYADVHRRLDEETRALRRDLRRARGAAAKTLTVALKKAEARRDGFLESHYAKSLKFFEESPEAFERDFVGPYYRSELDPGLVTPAQQRTVLLELRGKGARAVLNRVLGVFGLTLTAAEIDAKLKALELDERLEWERVRSDRLWRARMRSDCLRAGGKDAASCLVR
ncbi:MAG: hypothetical protein WC969_00320 [Elusimicrobiota bacterium]|jgi:hypothetical protein